MAFKILGKGFIGSNICEGLSAAGHYVEAFGSKIVDLTDYEAVESILPNLINLEDTVVFTAAITRLRDNSSTSHDHNVKMVENIVRLINCGRLKFSSLIFLSTVDVYGFSIEENLIHENLTVNPQDCYSKSKLLCERLFFNSLPRCNIPVLVLRLPGVYGPGDDRKSTIWKMVNSALLGGTINVFGNGENVRDFLHVDDISGFILQNIDARYDSRLLNIASGFSISISELAVKIQCITNSNISWIEQTEITRMSSMKFDLAALSSLYPDYLPTSLDAGLTSYIGYQRNKLRL
jgi:UDP-glucose 4-epimerase